jgi:hypothetical protein
MFFGLLDPDPLVRGTDPDSAHSIIKQMTFYLLKNEVSVASKSNKQKKILFPSRR